MFVAQRQAKRRGLRGLGTISTPVGTSLVYGSNPISQRAPVRGTIAYPSRYPTNGVSTTWGGNPPVRIFPVYQGGWSAANNPYGSSPQNPQNSQALAAAQALLATNPSLLTAQQYAMLQAAGLISSTLPYSSVSQIPSAYASASAVSTVNDPQCAAAGCTGGPYPNCTCAAAAASSTDIGTMLQTSYGGLPLYLWLIIGGGALFLFTSKRGR